MLKRMISMALCAVLLITLACGAVSVEARADRVVFSLATTNGGVGDTITVTVSLSGDSYFTNTTMSLYYDPSVVQFSEERTGAISPGSAMFMVLDYPNDGFVKGAYVAAKPIKKAGALLEFDFVIVKETEMVFSLGFEECVGEENGEMFDVNYQAGTCVLNKGKGQPATTAKPLSTTRVTAVPTTANKPANTTKAPVNTTVATTTVPVTYPTDAHGITLAPHVVTEADGNAATKNNGEVVTMATTTTTTPAVPTDEGDPNTTKAGTLETGTGFPDWYDSAEDPEDNTWVIPVIVILIAVAIASGCAALVMIRKKKAAKDTEQ